MASANDSQNEGAHRSAFGFLRLLFASLVIVSHAPELVDGDRSREPLTRIFGTISFGDLAVDCFFIISGYLIVGSYLKYPRVNAYLRKRISRIYPAFIVASLVSLMIVAPLAGTDMQWVTQNPLFSCLRIALLQPPHLPHAFAGQKYSELDGAMWTIAYEFRCYLLVLLFAFIGILRRPPIMFASALLLFVAFECLPIDACSYIDQQIPLSKYWVGSSHHTLRFTGMFLMGAVFYVERERITFSSKRVAAATVLLSFCLYFEKLAEPAVAIFGAYILFAAASWGGSRKIGKINDETDISYGTYLYAWPVSQLLIRYCPALPVPVQGTVTLIVAAFCGWVSWNCIEQPALIAVGRKLAESAASRTPKDCASHTSVNFS